MQTIIPMKMEDGSTLYIQSIPVHKSGDVLASGSKIVKAEECLENALPSVTEFCKSMKEAVQEKLKPDEIKLEFSVGFTADMDAIIASASAEAGITLQLVWKKDCANK